jgi:hypothetical protein
VAFLEIFGFGWELHADTTAVTDGSEGVVFASRSRVVAGLLGSHAGSERVVKRYRLEIICCDSCVSLEIRRNRILKENEEGKRGFTWLPHLLCHLPYVD